MMDNINLLPEDLRKAEDKQSKSYGEQIIYTNPRKEVSGKVDDKLVKSGSSAKGWWQRFSEKRKQKKEESIQKRKAVDEALAKSRPVAEVRPEAVARNIPVRPAVPPAPKVEPVVLAKSKVLAMPSGLPWWRKIFQRKKQPINTNKELGAASIMPAPAVQRPIASPPVIKPHAVAASEQPRLEPTVDRESLMHVPQNNRLREAPVVDLAADRSLFFSWSEFNHRLKIGAIALAVVIIFLVSLYFVITRILLPTRDKGRDIDADIQRFEIQLKDFDKKKEQIAALDKKITQISAVLTRHLFWSKLFSLLEKNTLANVYYTNMSVDESGKVIISALASDYPTLAGQIAVWQKEEAITNFDFSSASVSQQSISSTDANARAEMVSFDVTLNIKPSFLAE